MATTPATEVKLLKDDNWKLIQQNTFTRWVNQQLKQVVDGQQIDNLATDFSDGIVLIKLAEVLSGHSLPRYNKKATMRTQKLDNVSLVLGFFQNKEGIKIVNIDSSHIVDRNLKLILGLVWTLILHYSLSHRHFSSGDGDGEAVEKKETPKQRLLSWIQSKLPHHPVSNFTSSWNDGISLGALVDACLGGGFGEWRDWNPADGLENTRKAMQAAEQALGVETLITPEELLDPNVDEKSVMTYLAQFPRAQPQQLGQISGLDQHPFIGAQTSFSIEFNKANLDPEVSIMGPRGQKLPAEISFPVDNSFRHQISFVPKLVGEHKVTLYAKNTNDSRAPLLPVESATIHAIPALKVVGLDRKAELGERCRFQVLNVTDHHQLDVKAVDPDGREIILDAGSERDENSITCCYTPREPGDHAINVLYNKRHISGSPFTLTVTGGDGGLNGRGIGDDDRLAPATENGHEPLIQRVTSSPEVQLAPAPLHDDTIVWGRGILPKGAAACEEMPIHVDNCRDPVKVDITKDHLLIPVSPKTFSQPFGAVHPRQSFAFIPRTSGRYEVTVKAGDVMLGKSPYKVNVGPKNLSSVRAIGPGLEGGVVGEEGIFYVDTHGRADQLEFAIEGPSETQICCTDNGDGTALVKYTPHHPGRYIVKITELDNNTHIKDSPFVLWVEPNDSQPFPQTQRPLKIPPMENNEGHVGKLFGFTLPKNIEAEILDVEVYDPNLNKVELNNRTGSQGYHFSFTPEKEGKHIISIVADKLAIDGWPSRVSVSGPLDPNKIWLSGPGLSPTIQTHQKTNFTVDARAIPKPKWMEVSILDPSAQEMHPAMDMTESNVYNVCYEPKKAGVYQISVHVNKQQVFVVPVHALDRADEEERADEQLLQLQYTPDINDNRQQQEEQQKETAGKIMNAGARLADEIPGPIVGLSTAILFNCSGQHNIDGLAMKVKAPNGRAEHDMKLEQIAPEQFRLSFVPKQSGLHVVEIENDLGQIEGSPFKIPVSILGTQRAYMAYANGPGLAVGVVGAPNVFTVWNAGELGAGELTLSVDGPSKADVSTVPVDDTFQVTYIVQQPGLYTINVLFNDAPISGSPFKVFVKPPTTESLSKATTPATAANEKPFDYTQMETNYNPVQINFNESPNDSAFYEPHNNDPPPQLLTRNPGLPDNGLPISTPIFKQQQNHYDGDARLVHASGEGLDSFVPGKPTEFVVDTSKTGMNTLFVGIVTSQGPTEEVNVRHMGSGKYLVTYIVPFNSEALIYVKYGDTLVHGAPFSVNPGAVQPKPTANGKDHYFSI